MQPIPLEPGMCVRCVDATTYGGRIHKKLTHGREYAVLGVRWEYVDLIDDSGKKGGWLVGRFKPIVRVKAGSARSIGGALVSVITRVGSIELGTLQTCRWVERADGGSIFARAGR